MNILLVTFDPPQNVGGIEGRVRNYARHLKKLGHYAEIVSIFPGGDFSRTEIFDVPMLSLPSSLRSLLRTLRATSKEISKNSIDTIFFLSGALTLYGVFTLYYARTKGIRTLVLYYGKDILSARESYLQSFALWISPKLARKIVTNSRYTQGLLPKKYEKKIEILYPSVDPEIVSEAGPIQVRPERIVLFVGRLVARKGVDDLIHAFKDVVASVPDSSLEIVGDGPELASLQALSLKIGVSEKVRFYGKLSGRDLYDRYLACNVFVMPSKTTKVDTEGFGTVFLEASVFGKPSIGTFSGGIPEAILDNVTGILVPESDVARLSRAMESLLLNPQFASELGENARKRALDQFTWEKSTELLASMFS
jgi:glycosyltransferase involved in cell wall biosynthesis